MKSLIDSVKERSTNAQAPDMTQGQDSMDDEELAALVKQLELKIKVVGCGGGGSNTISRIHDEGLDHVDLIAVNTDAKHLLNIKADHKILIGKKLTRGLGAGADPRVGAKSAEEEEERIREAIKGANIVFITCGLGGGTGTGSAPVVARYAKEAGALVIAFATKPFKAEGQVRMNAAEAGLTQLAKHCNTVVTVSNDKLLELAPKLPLNQAFLLADELLMTAIKGLCEMVTKPGLVNIDYNDLRTVMDDGGIAVIGLGESEEEGTRAEDAFNKAIHSPLLEYDIKSARGVLVKVTGGPNMTLQEAEKVIELVQQKVSPSTRIIWGAAVDPEHGSRVTVLILANGVESTQVHGIAKQPIEAGHVGAKGAAAAFDKVK
ncbi:MAG: cell division protein FtsZ [Thermoplasmata archaeon]